MVWTLSLQLKVTTVKKNRKYFVVTISYVALVRHLMYFTLTALMLISQNLCEHFYKQAHSFFFQY